MSVFFGFICFTKTDYVNKVFQIETTSLFSITPKSDTFLQFYFQMGLKLSVVWNCENSKSARTTFNDA